MKVGTLADSFHKGEWNGGLENEEGSAKKTSRTGGGKPESREA